MKYNEVCLADVCDLIAGYAFKSKDFGDFDDKVIKITHITPPIVDMNGLSGVDFSKYNREKLKRYIAKSGDYVLAMTGATIGKIGRIVSGEAYINQRVLLFKNKDAIDKDFLYYVLLQHDFEQYVYNHIDSESAQPNISATTIGKYIFSLPPMSIQQKIGRLLRSLDEKCEVNNAINHNLQQQFQALFDSWFKRFEPFSQPKYESELGLIPEGWSVKDIYSISSIIYGAPFSSKLFNDEHKGSPIVRIRDLKTQNTSTYTTEIHPKGYLIQNGDIIVGMDGEFRPYIWGSGEAWLNQRVCVFENKRPKGKVFLFCSIKPLLNLIEQTEVATTVIHIGKQDFDAFRIVMPPIEILNAFDDITAPMYNRIVNNIMENHRLSALRDSLLPRLMSGEINVSEVKL